MRICKEHVQDNLDKMEKAASKFETIYYNALKRGKKNDCNRKVV